MNIGLDMMGGDYSPLEAVKGIALYLKSAPAGISLFLVGDEQQIGPLLRDHAIPAASVKVIHAPQVIGMNEHPTKALKEKQQSSIAVGFHLLSTGKMDAFISAGNTGAMLVGALYTLKPIEGIQRPTISTILPKENGGTGVLLDVGLNADCKPENLNQFAILGSLYARHILGIADPRVGLLNIGEEEGKGNILAQAAYPLLKENQQIHFIGNIEGRDLLLDKADVMVCEGFVGNVVLKMAESLYDITQGKGIQHEYFDRFDFELYGGTPLLGVTKPVIIGHGISHERSFSNMIKLAQKMIATDLLGKMKESFMA
ncbi:MAG: phosphate acyltransferase PlsX [Bacteroidota bacterium]|nr:phosphate acyltransferase PlsX [Bacteroidota bacterium]MDP4217178.1 phosphate acyltransferase PlsX [Bacteroidota bacterium]MDP4245397.1 phosphate acyltransferase PlsX [Bacteroidota bacterium]MDP4259619.1 phosphate acyltransferase PlsX [Bacteroidota bacterium]